MHVRFQQALDILSRSVKAFNANEVNQTLDTNRRIHILTEFFFSPLSSTRVGTYSAGWRLTVFTSIKPIQNQILIYYTKCFNEWGYIILLLFHSTFIWIIYDMQNFLISDPSVSLQKLESTHLTVWNRFGQYSTSWVLRIIRMVIL